MPVSSELKVLHTKIRTVILCVEDELAAIPEDSKKLMLSELEKNHDLRRSLLLTHAKLREALVELQSFFTANGER